MQQGKKTANDIMQMMHMRLTGLLKESVLMAIALGKEKDYIKNLYDQLTDPNVKQETKERAKSKLGPEITEAILEFFKESPADSMEEEFHAGH